MIRKTVKTFLRKNKKSLNKKDLGFMEVATFKSQIQKTTYWFLFLPVYSKEEELGNNLSWN